MGMGSPTNLQGLVIGHAKRIDINRVSLDVLAPILPSFTGNLKQLKWTQEDTTRRTWKNLYPPTGPCGYRSVGFLQ